MLLDQFYNASEEEKIAEMLGMGIEYADEYRLIDIELMRNIYKKYCLEHGITADNWYLGIYE